MNKYLRAILATVAFIAVLLLTYYLHMRYFRVNVVLYASILDALIALVVVFGTLYLLKCFRDFSRLELIQLAAIWLLGGYLFAISVPTVIDRSLSFYILEKLQQRGGGIREDAFRQVFTEEYVREHHLVEVRLTEQLQSGTIDIEHGCVKLTPRGERLASFSRFYRRNLLPTHRLLMGQYTDALTDPFRDSHMSNDYRCR
ncbi:TPA: hypothetical protein ACG5JQ_002491 [Stenotrophomonas maltophilia]|jgi:hypothetical protein|uniref:Transmembrane protein n=1 Tax=Stenotrophomonas maltophilia TaxID=40324 RepID=A0AAI9FXK4_STEMA|nr:MULTISPECIES: hypothetical protein [Stenotrophomonas]EKT4439622.1 hypothetical protein [Stenotrophomonas maltophilia]MBH1444875.1 hypothetical protein [Stenotrophomonas maltophilia]MBN4991237.1 hypothetical protein [Stenotrophomonas maltophilia]MBN5011587.1 hypothetical protein [Stenotrophomonas maltophilia]MCI1130463.1 hypothetical protein [Stenotrophomonas maltophilia]